MDHALIIELRNIVGIIPVNPGFQYITGDGVNAGVRDIDRAVHMAFRACFGRVESRIRVANALRPRTSTTTKSGLGDFRLSCRSQQSVCGIASDPTVVGTDLGARRATRLGRRALGPTLFAFVSAMAVYMAREASIAS
jgi:hypothetical protein